MSLQLPPLCSVADRIRAGSLLRSRLWCDPGLPTGFFSLVEEGISGRTPQQPWRPSSSTARFFSATTAPRPYSRCRPRFPCFVIHLLVGEHAALVFFLPALSEFWFVHPSSVAKKTLMRLCCECSLGWDTGTRDNCVLSFVVTCSVYAFTVCIPICGGQVWRPSPCFPYTCVARCGVSQPRRCSVRLLSVRNTLILGIFSININCITYIGYSTKYTWGTRTRIYIPGTRYLVPREDSSNSGSKNTSCCCSLFQQNGAGGGRGGGQQEKANTREETFMLSRLHFITRCNESHQTQSKKKRTKHEPGTMMPVRT